MVVMGFPFPSSVPPKRNRKPRLTPRVRGFSFFRLKALRRETRTASSQFPNYRSPGASIE
jgi:hypothetical protein